MACTNCGGHSDLGQAFCNECLEDLVDLSATAAYNEARAEGLGEYPGLSPEEMASLASPVHELLQQAQKAALKVSARRGEGGPNDHEILAAAVLALVEYLKREIK